MVKGIKGLAKVKEYSKTLMFLVEVTGYSTIKIIYGHIGRSVGSKTVLMWA